jgi:hypothetical protein
MLDLYLYKGNPMLFADFAKDFISDYFKSCNIVQTNPLPKSKIDDFNPPQSTRLDENHQDPLNGDN